MVPPGDNQTNCDKIPNKSSKIIDLTKDDEPINANPRRVNQKDDQIQLGILEKFKRALDNPNAPVNKRQRVNSPGPHSLNSGQFFVKHPRIQTVTLEPIELGAAKLNTHNLSDSLEDIELELGFPLNLGL
jgi:hypothetical protein